MKVEPKVNDVVYIYEREKANHDAAGNYLGRGCWTTHAIIGETKQSWLLSNKAKVAKNDPYKTRKQWDFGDNGIYRVSYSLEEVQQEDWAKTNRRRLSEAVLLTSVTNLKKIAEIIGI